MFARLVCALVGHRLMVIWLPTHDIAVCARCRTEWGDWS